MTQLLQHDPKQRLTAAELVTHPWVRGEDVPVAPLPATHERLSAFIKARAIAFDRLRPPPTAPDPNPTHPDSNTPTYLTLTMTFTLRRATPSTAHC